MTREHFWALEKMVAKVPADRVIYEVATHCVWFAHESTMWLKLVKIELSPLKQMCCLLVTAASRFYDIAATVQVFLLELRPLLQIEVGELHSKLFKYLTFPPLTENPQSMYFPYNN